jgi:CheY-like chemotaxis protein
MLGWAVLSQLKQDPRTRHIPVQIVTLDEDRQHGLAGGAFAFVNKPTTMDKLKASIARLSEYARDSPKRLLIVEDNPAELLSITELLGYQDIEVVTADNGREALAMLREQPTDCVVLDLRLPDMSGFELLEHIRQDDALTQVPVVVFTGRELSPEEDAQWHSIARSVIVKGVESPERLLDERRFSSIAWSRISRQTSSMLERLRNSDENLHGRKALLVDDDARNIFALSSVLERRGMEVLTATTGREAIAILKADRGISIVLMDIMMPEMDGYETIQAIREDPSVRRLPSIALTAKAMKGDRERCLEAGLGLPGETGQYRATAFGASHLAIAEAWGRPCSAIAIR